MTPIDPKRSALLVMDYQKGILERVPDQAPRLIDQAKMLIEKARAAQMSVIYVVIGFRAGYPEISPRNASFSKLMKDGGFTEVPGSDIPPSIGPQPGDLVVVKHRVSAFSGSDLEMVLRSKGIETLVLMGLSTGGVVLSTTRQAADLDYRLVVIHDACGDADPEIHRVLTEKVLTRQASVISAKDYLEALSVQ
jgi:nicotinamidase-related amidase